MASRATPVSIVRPVPPFRLDLTAWALRRRPRNLIDRWDESTYRRVIQINRRPIELAVRQVGSATDPRLIVKTAPAVRTPQERRRVRTLLDRLLGLRVDLTGWYRVAAQDPRLHLLAQRFRGVKPPRFPTVFEALVNAFACQQLSLEAGLTLLNRLATMCGVKTGRDDHHAFPGPPDVVRRPPARYRAIGLSHQKVRAIRDAARAIARRDLDPDSLDRDSDEAIKQRLVALRGVGRWTAEYVLLRGLGRLEVFPGDDVGAQKRLARWLGRAHPLDYAGVQRAVERWHPYAGMVYFHLLLDGLGQRGVLEPGAKAAGRSSRKSCRS